MEKRRRTEKSKIDLTSRFIWMFFGLTIGLLVAASVYILDQWELLFHEPTETTSESSPRVVVIESQRNPAASERPHPAERFDFYDILPKFEVVLPAVESEVTPDREIVPIGEPGSYVLQAGSFTNVTDAERMRATLALLGLESRLQRVSIDDDIYHRVRIGPLSNLNELNRYRRQLREAEVEVLLIKVPN